MSSEPTTTERRPRRIRADRNRRDDDGRRCRRVDRLGGCQRSRPYRDDRSRHRRRRHPVRHRRGPGVRRRLSAHGNAFITQGYIYPAGTLTDSNGVNPDGTPEFPTRSSASGAAAATSSARAPTPQRERGSTRPSCSPSATTPTPGPRPSSSPATKAPKSAPSSPAPSPAAPATTPPPAVRPTKNCSGSTTPTCPPWASTRPSSSPSNEADDAPRGAGTPAPSSCSLYPHLAMTRRVRLRCGSIAVRLLGRFAVSSTAFRFRTARGPGATRRPGGTLLLAPRHGAALAAGDRRASICLTTSRPCCTRLLISSAGRRECATAWFWRTSWSPCFLGLR